MRSDRFRVCAFESCDMTRISLLALAFASAAGPVFAESTILPGYWESTSRVSVLISDTSKKHTCVRPEQVEEFLSGPNNRHYRCTYHTRRVANGRVDLSGTCVDKKNRRLDASVQGTYTPTEFHLTGSFRYHLLGIPIPGTAALDARRLGATCPAGAK